MGYKGVPVVLGEDILAVFKGESVLIGGILSGYQSFPGVLELDFSAPQGGLQIRSLKASGVFKGE